MKSNNVKYCVQKMTVTIPNKLDHNDKRIKITRIGNISLNEYVIFTFS